MTIKPFNTRHLHMLLFLNLTLPISSSFAQPGGPDRPDVILIIADDLGYSDTGCYDATDHDTPNLDRMVREGLRFTVFYTAFHIPTICGHTTPPNQIFLRTCPR